MKKLFLYSLVMGALMSVTFQAQSKSKEIQSKDSAFVMKCSCLEKDLVMFGEYLGKVLVVIKEDFHKFTVEDIKNKSGPMYRKLINRSYYIAEKLCHDNYGHMAEDWFTSADRIVPSHCSSRYMLNYDPNLYPQGPIFDSNKYTYPSHRYIKNDDIFN